jgi:hypothetical protein
VKGQVSILNASHDQKLAALETAIKSIRKTGCYGTLNKNNFEWPKAYDLRNMLKNMPTKITDLKHTTSTTSLYTHCFGAFQVVLSNGMASPVMKTKN